MNSIMSDLISRRVMSREEVSCRIRLIVNLESDQ